MKELSFSQSVERSISKKFRKQIWTKFVLALKRYNLVEENDKIAVCISGGKDSMLLALLMKMLKQYSDVKFDLVFLSMDPGYAQANRELLQENANKLEIPLKIFETNIFDTVFKMDGSPCYVCARMRRGYLYSEAKKLGCNKIALAHHFSDVIETTLMSMFYGAQLQAMPPKLKSKNFEGMELIRPLYCVHEDDIIAWKNYNGLTFLNCACRFTENCQINGDNKSARKNTKQLIKNLSKSIPDIEEHIFNSIHNVNIDTFCGLKFLDKNYDFNEFYKIKNSKEEDNKTNAK